MASRSLLLALIVAALATVALSQAELGGYGGPYGGYGG